MTRHIIGYVPVICSCLHCREEIATANLMVHNHQRHQHIYPKTPKIFGNCDCCGKLLRGYENKRFCSRSCSASFNNNKRKESGEFHSQETREKIRESVKKNPSGFIRKMLELGHHPNKGKSSKQFNCCDCGIELNYSAKYCVSCRVNHVGGAREGSGYSKSGYYKGIYCGSSYELVWVIYRLDHDLPVERFNGFITYGNNKRYFPDFVEGSIIHEMKGWTTEKTDPVLKEKELGAMQAGFSVKLYFKEDLEKEFNWVKENYKYKNIEELYDAYTPKFSYTCDCCGVEFHSNKRKSGKNKFCGRVCSGKFRKLTNTSDPEWRTKISSSLLNKKIKESDCR